MKRSAWLWCSCAVVLAVWLPRATAQDGCGIVDCPSGGSGPCVGVSVDIKDVSCTGNACTVEIEVSTPNGNAASKVFNRSGNSTTSATLCNRASPPCCVTLTPCVSWSDAANNCCIFIDCE